MSKRSSNDAFASCNGAIASCNGGCNICASSYKRYKVEKIWEETNYFCYDDYFLKCGDCGVAWPMTFDCKCVRDTWINIKPELPFYNDWSEESWNAFDEGKRIYQRNTGYYYPTHNNFTQ